MAISAKRFSRHPDIDMVSFTGSTRAGILVAKAAADTVSRGPELGGKSAISYLPDSADRRPAGRAALLTNTGRSCSADPELLVAIVRQNGVKPSAIASRAVESRGAR